MILKQVGNSGLKVSSIGLGTLTLGRDTDSEEYKKQLYEFIENGGNLIDTAPNYGEKNAEKILGSIIKDNYNRADLILSSKAGIKFTKTGSYIDISKKNLLENLDNSLKNLGTDYLDLWFISQPDYNISFDELIETLEYALSTGRTRYVGLSNFPAWALAQINSTMKTIYKKCNLTCAQMEYNLLQRGIEKEVLPYCEYNNVGILAWSPLGRGVLTGKYKNEIPADSRAASTHLYGFIEPYLNERSAHIVNGLIVAAEGLEITPAQVALKWVTEKKFISSAIVGTRTVAQLREFITMKSQELPEQIVTALDTISKITIGYPEKF